MKCLNCNTEFEGSHNYCINCGQSSQNVKLSVLQIVKEAFNSVFNINSKFFQTLYYIYKPAMLTQAYVKGQRKKYLHPFRLFLVLMVSAITLVLWNFDYSLGAELKDSIISDLAYKDVESKIDSLKSSTGDYDVRTLDTLSMLLKIDGVIDDSLYFFDHVEGLDLSKIPPIAKKDMIEMDVPDILEKYEIENFWHKLAVTQYISLNLNLAGGIQYIIRNFIWTFLVTIILMSWFLKLLYIRRNYYYVEHLVMMLYGVSLFVLFLVFCIILNNFFPELNIVAAVFFIIVVLLIQFIAFKEYYKQSNVKTIIKFLLFNYAFVFTTIMISLLGSIFLLLIY